MEGEVQWNPCKHGGPKRRVWRKTHLGIDEQTLEVRAVETIGHHIGDAPILPDLLSKTPADEQIGSGTAHGAYDMRECHDAIADRSAVMNSYTAVGIPVTDSRRMNPSGKRGTSGIKTFVQQDQRRQNCFTEKILFDFANICWQVV